MKTALVLLALGFSTSANAQNVEWCKDFVGEKLVAHAKIDCTDYCQVEESGVKVTFFSAEGGQDGSVTYTVEIPERITGNGHSQVYKHTYRVTAGYGRPPARFGIDSHCQLWSDIQSVH